MASHMAPPLRRCLNPHVLLVQVRPKVHLLHALTLIKPPCLGQQHLYRDLTPDFHWFFIETASSCFFGKSQQVPSGNLTWLINENDHRNSEFSHSYNGDFPVRHVKLPEGRVSDLNPHPNGLMRMRIHPQPFGTPASCCINSGPLRMRLTQKMVL